MNHVLKSKQALIKYIQSYKCPHILVETNHPAIIFGHREKRWLWSRQYLIDLSMKQLVELCKYLESFYRIEN